VEITLWVVPKTCQRPGFINIHTLYEALVDLEAMANVSVRPNNNKDSDYGSSSRYLSATKFTDPGASHPTVITRRDGLVHFVDGRPGPRSYSSCQEMLATGDSATYYSSLGGIIGAVECGTAS
jgi:hypothetical protein